MRMISMTPLAKKRVLLFQWMIFVLSCLHCSRSYAWMSPTPSRTQGRALCVQVGSRATCSRLSSESGNDNEKNELMQQQQRSKLPSRGEEQNSETSSSPESSQRAAPVVSTTPTSTVTSTEMTNQQLMAAIGTSPRRIIVAFASATFIALGANFLGVTSKLLTAVPESTVEASGLDVYFPRGDYKRCRGKGYTFSIPKEWVADTSVELAKVQRRAGSLDYGMSKTSSNSMLPDAAFGPPGRLDARGMSQGNTNVSVLRSTLPAGFSLRLLGTPTKVAETFLTKSLAPEGSGRTATLVDAREDVERQVDQFEYIVDRGERGPPLRAIAVLCVQDYNADAPTMTTLLTLTVVAPEAQWAGDYETKLRRIASSFHSTL